MEKTVRAKDEIFFECKKCKKIVCTAFGAIKHAHKAHKQKIHIDQVFKHYAEIKKPSQELIDQSQRKKQYQKTWRNKNAQDGKPGDRWKCNACGLIVGCKASLYLHCRIKHKKSFSAIGATPTREPLTNPNRSAHSTGPKLTDLLGQMPQVIRISKAGVDKKGVLLTIQIQVPTAYIASTIIPTITL